MSSYELTLAPVRPQRNAVTGRFMKGHIPANKGRKWNEWASKRSQKKMQKGWVNLITHRPKKRADTAGRCRKPIIAVREDGRFMFFKDSFVAGQWCGGRRENVNRCCRDNQQRKVNLKTGKINTDHQYMGIRWYFESDTANWQTKIIII